MQTTPLLTGQRPGDIRRLTRPVNLVAAVSIVVSLVVGLRVEPSTLWGFLPIALYGILAALGMRILVATSV